MDSVVCGLPRVNVVMGIGGAHAVIFCGLFLWKLADSIAQMIEYVKSTDTVILYIVVNDMTNSEILLGCVFSVCLIIGVRKRLPGLVLTWMMSQVVFIACSILTVLYFAVAPYLKITILEASIELLICGILMGCLYIVYTHFEEMRKGNLLNEEA